ncbi:MAG: hypothetical protein WCA12_18805 [Burkholderiales bacterium]
MAARKQRVVRLLAGTGRRRDNVRLVPPNTQGAAALLAALKRGEWVGILPDQVPAADRGEWAEFFGRPAYTMMLPFRLQERTDAAVIIVSSLAARLLALGAARDGSSDLP